MNWDKEKRIMFNRKDGNTKRIKIKLMILAVLVVVACGKKYFR